MKWNKVIPSGTPTLKYIMTRDSFIVYEGINNFYLDEGLIPGQTYNYQVQAVNLEGKGPFSISAVGTAAEKPSEPINFKIVTQSKTLVSFEFEPPVSDGGLSITEYNIYEDDGDLVFNNPAIPITTLTHSKLISVPGKVYSFKVSAINFLGEGELSQVF